MTWGQARRNCQLDSLEVDVQGQLDSNAGQPGYEIVPVYPHNINYTVSIKSSASDEALADLYEAVERACPILNLLINSQEIQGTLVRKSATEKGKPRSIASNANGKTKRTTAHTNGNGKAVAAKAQTNGVAKQVAKSKVR